MKLRLKTKAWQEKRESVRLTIECPVTYQVKPKRTINFLFQKPESFNAIMQNPSMFGMRILGDHEEKEGEILYISVHLEEARRGEKTHNLCGKVMWTKPWPAKSGFLSGIQVSSKSLDLGKWQAFIRGELALDERQEKSGIR